jgi:hypothetical protein
MPLLAHSPPQTPCHPKERAVCATKDLNPNITANHYDNLALTQGTGDDCYPHFFSHFASSTISKIVIYVGSETFLPAF